MPDYRRAHVPGGTYFFTVSTYRRQTFLTDADFHRYVKQGGCRQLGGAPSNQSTAPTLANELARTRALPHYQIFGD